MLALLAVGWSTVVGVILICLGVTITITGLVMFLRARDLEPALAAKKMIAGGIAIVVLGAALVLTGGVPPACDQDPLVWDPFCTRKQGG